MTLRDLQALIAFALIVAGVGLFSIPIALIAAGVLLAVDRVTS